MEIPSVKRQKVSCSDDEDSKYTAAFLNSDNRVKIPRNSNPSRASSVHATVVPGASPLPKKVISDVNNNEKSNCSSDKKGDLVTYNGTERCRFVPMPAEDYKILVSQRKSLPIYSARQRLLREFQRNDTVIVVGETGSGKTTQIPQYLHEERLDRAGGICVTQPRRIAAVSIAKRVAVETNSRLGSIVGYNVRFEEALSPATKVRYVTDGILLREAMLDPLLLAYKWIVLDEVHERSINNDILFGIVKSAQLIRKRENKESLCIIVMSATMDVDHISQYFSSAKVLYVEGRLFPIEIFHSKAKHDDYVLACMSTVFQIHKEADEGEDILVFLTGQDEIESVVRMIRQIANDKSLKDYVRLKVYPLYAALPSQQQMEVFVPSSPGERKVIVSTNIAETSLTLPGIKYVIDCGFCKVRTFHPSSGLDVLRNKRISKAQAWQRAGRAGREASGVCYRTYTQDEFNSFDANSVPELLRVNLSSVFLQLIAIGINDIENFDFIDKPDKELMNKAEEELVLLDAVQREGSLLGMTKMGWLMSKFPLEPRCAKILLCSTDYACTEEILTVISILSSESVFVNPSGSKERAVQARSKFTSVEGDHISMLKIFRAFKSSKQGRLWCQENFLNYRNLTYAANVKKQLKQICQRNNMPMMSCGENYDVIKKCLLTGLFTNVAELQHDGKYLCLSSRKEVLIHPTSALFGSKPPYILFTELVQTSRTYMHINSAVDPRWLVDIAPEYFRARHFRITSR